MNMVRLVDQIKHGDKVTIVNAAGAKVTGRAVMKNSIGGWTLNLGGRYGTPALADDSNVIRVQKPKGRR